MQPASVDPSRVTEIHCSAAGPTVGSGQSFFEERVLGPYGLPGIYEWAFLARRQWIVVWPSTEVAQMVYLRCGHEHCSSLEPPLEPAELRASCEQTGVIAWDALKTRLGLSGLRLTPTPNHLRSLLEGLSVLPQSFNFRSQYIFLGLLNSEQAATCIEWVNTRAPELRCVTLRSHLQAKLQRMSEDWARGFAGRASNLVGIPPAPSGGHPVTAPVASAPASAPGSMSASVSRDALRTTLFEVQVDPNLRLHCYRCCVTPEDYKKDAIVMKAFRAAAAGRQLLPQFALSDSFMVSSAHLILEPSQEVLWFGRRYTLRVVYEGELCPADVLADPTNEPLYACEQGLNVMLQEALSGQLKRFGKVFLRHGAEPRSAYGFEVYDATHCELGFKVFHGRPTVVVNLNPCRKVFNQRTLWDEIHARLRSSASPDFADLEGCEVVTRYNPQLYTVVEVVLEKTARDELRHLGGCTAEQYLLQNYGLRLSEDHARSCLVVARPVASQRGGSRREVELVSSQCHLRAEEGTRGGGPGGAALAQLCTVAVADRINEAVEMANRLRGALASAPAPASFAIGAQVTVPFQRLPDPEVHLAGIGRVESRQPWAPKLSAMSYRPTPLKMLCVLDKPAFARFCSRADRESVCQLLLRHRVQLLERVVSKDEFLDPSFSLPLTEADAVLHMGDGSEGSYQRVKRKCDALGVAAQCMDPERHLRSNKSMFPIVSNVKTQLMAKRQQLPWTIFVQDLHRRGLRTVIVVGQDAFHSRARLPRHDGRRGTTPMASIIGLVAFQMTVEESGEVKWKHFCQFREVEPRKEFLLRPAGVLRAFCEELRELWGVPDGLLMCRDGVGRGDFEANVRTQELPQLQEVFPEVPLTYTIVQKRIRFACASSQGLGMGSPPLGALVDQLRDLSPTPNAFLTHYLHPTSSSATPVQYVVLQHGLQPQMPMDDLRVLLYHLCFMYPTWSHSIKVPLPVQCAHRLANYVADRRKAEAFSRPPMPREGSTEVKDRTKLFYL